MHGLMQRRNLLISSVLEHADRHHGAAEVVSHRDNGALSRTTYAELASRARRLARVLSNLGVRPGDRVATLAMNSDRHLELYYAISGIGAICSTINPRLSHDDIAFIAHHVEDGLIFADPDFLPLSRTRGAARSLRGQGTEMVYSGSGCHRGKHSSWRNRQDSEE
jgi:3-(methylthio)propionyl---CoA ligase